MLNNSTLEEQNFNLRMQVSKLQVALNHALSKSKQPEFSSENFPLCEDVKDLNKRISDLRAALAAASQSEEALQDELIEARKCISELKSDNARLQRLLSEGSCAERMVGRGFEAHGKPYGAQGRPLHQEPSLEAKEGPSGPGNVGLLAENGARRKPLNRSESSSDEDSSSGDEATHDFNTPPTPEAAVSPYVPLPDEELERARRELLDTLEAATSAERLGEPTTTGATPSSLGGSGCRDPVTASIDAAAGISVLAGAAGNGECDGHPDAETCGANTGPGRDAAHAGAAGRGPPPWSAAEEGGYRHGARSTNGAGRRRSSGPSRGRSREPSPRPTDGQGDQHCGSGEATAVPPSDELWKPPRSAAMTRPKCRSHSVRELLETLVPGGAGKGVGAGREDWRETAAGREAKEGPLRLLRPSPHLPLRASHRQSQSPVGHVRIPPRHRRLRSCKLQIPPRRGKPPFPAGGSHRSGGGGQTGRAPAGCNPPPLLHIPSAPSAPPAKASDTVTEDGAASGGQQMPQAAQTCSPSGDLLGGSKGFLERSFDSLHVRGVEELPGGLQAHGDEHRGGDNGNSSSTDAAGKLQTHLTAEDIDYLHTEIQILERQLRKAEEQLASPAKGTLESQTLWMENRKARQLYRERHQRLQQLQQEASLVGFWERTTEETGVGHRTGDLPCAFQMHPAAGGEHPCIPTLRDAASEPVQYESCQGLGVAVPKRTAVRGRAMKRRRNPQERAASRLARGLSAKPLCKELEGVRNHAPQLPPAPMIERLQNQGHARR